MICSPLWAFSWSIWFYSFRNGKVVNNLNRKKRWLGRHDCSIYIRKYPKERVILLLLILSDLRITLLSLYFVSQAVAFVEIIPHQHQSPPRASHPLTFSLWCLRTSDFFFFLKILSADDQSVGCGGWGWWENDQTYNTNWKYKLCSFYGEQFGNTYWGSEYI